MPRIKKAFFPVTGRNSYCGPTAVSALLGVSRDDVALHVARLRGHSMPQNVKGIHVWEIHSYLLKKVSYTAVRRERLPDRPKLRSWRERPDVEERFDQGWRALGVVTEHFVAMSRQMIHCARQKEPTHYISGRSTDCKLEEVIWLTPLAILN